MAKKDRTTDSAAPSTVPNRDLMQRMSFLYQASVHLRAQAGAAQSASAADEMTRLSRKHVRTVKAISNGSVVKLDPSVKRVLCKACDTVLVPGSTATVRVKTSGPHGKTISYTCVSCHTRREIPASPTPSKTGNEAGGKSKARPPPFFARVDAGHVRVRGTERICDE